VVASADGVATPVRGAVGVSAVAFAAAPGRALAGLLRSASGARDLAVWGEPGEAPAVAARDVSSFAFSPDGAWIAAIAGVAPGSAGDLVAIPVPASAAAGPVVVARGVGEFRWAPGANRLAWLAGFDARVHAGALASAAPGAPAVPFAPQVTSFELSPSGEQLAFVRHVTEGGYAARLELSPTQAAVPGTVTTDAASFDFSGDGRWLYYRSGCAPSGEACTLLRTPATGLAPGQPPERIADGVVAFVVDRRRPDRVLLSLARRDGAGVDLAIWSAGKVSPLDGTVLPGSPRFLGPEGRRVAWIVGRPDRAGVYVADAP
jgi:hypothetical protein